MNEIHWLIQLAYLLAASLFIFGLKGLSHPRSAVRGNLFGASGMLVAVVATLCTGQPFLILVVLGIAIGSVLGYLLATRIQMTDMPQMVALLNGLGGLASLLVAGAALCTEGLLDAAFGLTTSLSGFIGGVTFTGSLVAFCKLQGITIPGLISSGGTFLPARHLINGALAAVCVGLLVLLTSLATASWTVEVIETTQDGVNRYQGEFSADELKTLSLQAQAKHSGPVSVEVVRLSGWPLQVSYWMLVLAALALGVLLVIPIGGADMPVVIALLNSYSGLAAAMTGFVISNSVLIISGSLVGASGLILTQIMCKAMNRSLANVLFARLGPAETDRGNQDEVYAGRIKSTSAEEIAMLLETARRVVVVPGYGMAVAQAQHPVQELAELLESRGTEVEYGIHPVAGRMPGHMNVLLAEAEVPHEKQKQMEEINPTFSQTDVAIIIGANDVVNPVANTDPKSPIAGMPILNVHEARTVVVIKRSLSPGFAGIPNPLFAQDNTLMYFSDGKQAVVDLVQAMKELA